MKKWQAGSFLLVPIMFLSILTSAAQASTPECRFAGQVVLISGKKSVCAPVSGNIAWINVSKKPTKNLSKYEKTKLKAYRAIQNAISKEAPKNIELKYDISANFPEELKARYIEQSEYATRLYDQFFNQPTIVNVYLHTEKDEKYIRSHPLMGKDASDFDVWFADWRAGRLTQHNIGLIARFGEQTGKAEGHTGVLVPSSSKISTLQLYADQVVAHEYFHVIQDLFKYKRDQQGYELGPNGFDLYYPPIFREGSANTVATAVSMRNFEDYLLFYRSFILQNISSKPFNTLTSTSTIIKVLNEIEYGKSFPEAHWTAYPVGSLVFEWLIAEYGFDTYKKIVYNQELNKPFEENLKLSTGLTMDQLYAKSAQHVLGGFQDALKLNTLKPVQRR
jgi:hypothetical protein